MPLTTEKQKEALNELAESIHVENIKAGWWNDLTTGEPLPLDFTTFGVKLALIHSELSEALEGVRKNLMDDKLPHRPMAEVELADTAIRLFDLIGAFGYDLGGALSEKREYNSNREDHKLETRRLANGKRG